MIIVNKSEIENLTHDFDALASELQKAVDVLDIIRDTAPPYKALPSCYTRVQMQALIRLVGFIRDSSAEELTVGREAPGVDHELSLLIRLLEHLTAAID